MDPYHALTQCRSQIAKRFAHVLVCEMRVVSARLPVSGNDPAAQKRPPSRAPPDALRRTPKGRHPEPNVLVVQDAIQDAILDTVRASPVNGAHVAE